MRSSSHWRSAIPVSGHRSDTTALSFFALSGWASLSREGTPKEDIALSLDFRHVQGGIECRADVARGDGQILAETAAQTLDASGEPETVGAALWAAMATVEAFLETNTELLAAELAAV